MSPPPGSILYLDHAATSWPKAPGVVDAVAAFLTEVGANPGRSAHRRSAEASRILFRTREALARLFRAPDSERVVFTANVTEAINLVLLGHCRRGDHVVTTDAEHNALMRPLAYLAESRDVVVTRIPTTPSGDVDPADLHAALRPSTRLVAFMHGSNVTGLVRDLPALLTAADGVPVLLDAAQTAGSVPIDLTATPVAWLAFTGHKGLLGPMGTGGLVLAPAHDLPPLVRGGTGSNSAHEEQPRDLPDALESGTPNAPGLAGLLAAVTWLEERGVDHIHQAEERAAARMTERLSACPQVRVHGAAPAGRRLPTLSVTIPGRSVSDLGLRLDREHGVLVRVGLHCAPSAHRSLGTWPEGTLRLSAGPFLSDDELDRALDALVSVAAAAH